MTEKQTKRRMPGTAWVVIGFMLGVFVTPFIEHYGKKAVDSLTSPDVRIRVESILLTKSRSSKVPRVKLVYVSYNDDAVDRTISLTHLVADTYDLSARVPIEAVRLPGEGIHRDSVMFDAPELQRLFILKPSLATQQWKIEFQIGGDRGEYAQVLDTSSIEKLVYVLTPTTKLIYPAGFRQDAWNIQAKNMVFFTADDGEAGQASEVYNVIIYPRRWVRLGIDTSYDGIDDWFIEPGEQVGEPAFKGFLNSISFDPALYAQREAGCIIATEVDYYERDSLFYQRLCGESFDHMYDVYQAFIDPDIFLTDEFIYVKYEP